MSQKTVYLHPVGDVLKGWNPVPSTVVDHYKLVNGDPLLSDDSTTEIVAVLNAHERFTLNPVPASFHTLESISLRMRRKAGAPTVSLIVNGEPQASSTPGFSAGSYGYEKLTLTANLVRRASLEIDFVLPGEIGGDETHISDFDVELIYNDPLDTPYTKILPPSTPFTRLS